MDNQYIQWYIHINRTLLSSNKDWRTDMPNNTNESQKCYLSERWQSQKAM